ncbi:MAG: hypothetical protein AAF804_14005 [Bacteroidota bacterium]
MKFNIILCVLLLGVCGSLSAQNTEWSMDDMGRIALTPILPVQAEGVSATTNQNLLNRLQRVATQEGLGAVSRDSRFLLVVNMDVIDKNVTATAPPMVAMNVDLSLLIVDYETKNTFSSAVVSLRGAGQNETKATMQALKGLRSNDPELRRFMADGKRKIIEWYNAQCDFIIKKAQTEASMQNFDQALYTLVTVPEVCKDCYFRAMDEATVIYDQYLDFLCERNLQAAKSTWIANPNMRGANAVIPYLSALQPDAACFDEAESLVDEIRQKVRQDEQRDWNFMLKQWDDGVSLESQRIEAMRQVGVAYGNNQPERVYQLDFLGRY